MNAFRRWTAMAKNSKIARCFITIFEYFYIRWKVLRTVSGEMHDDDDSLASSTDDPPRKKIFRSTSVYPPFCIFKKKQTNFFQKPTCIDIYNNFMDNCAPNGTPVKLVFEKDRGTCSNSFIVETKKLDKLSHSKSSDSVFDAYNIWIEHGRNSIEMSSGHMPGEKVKKQMHYTNGTDFNNYFNVATKGSKQMTYIEEQRQVRNYLFTAPRYNTENQLNFFESHLDVASSNSTLINKKLMKSCTSYSLSGLSIENEFSQSMSSHSSDYQTASISSPTAKTISDRFSTLYWSVTERNGDGATGARDNYHNRYFGKAGYFLTRSAIENHTNEADTMPALERRSLEKERSRWEKINQVGRTYDHVFVPTPDTNGINNAWKNEYEVSLPNYSSKIWKQPKKYVPRYTNLF